jgi:hypothetical protein
VGSGVGSGVGATGVAVCSGRTVGSAVGGAAVAVGAGGAVGTLVVAVLLAPPQPASRSVIPTIKAVYLGAVVFITTARLRAMTKDAVRADAQRSVDNLALVTTFERPAPDLNKITEAWRVWTEGGEDVLPGRSMADLKIGGIDKVLETLAADNEALMPVFDIWMTWEKGKMTPEVALGGLTENGFADIVEALDTNQ